MTKHDPEDDEAPTSDAQAPDAPTDADESDEDEAPPISADTSNGAATSAPARPANVAPPASALVAYGAAIAVTALVAGTFQVAFSPTFAGTNRSFLMLGGLYAVTSVLAVLRLKKRGELFRIRPRSGDITFAGLVAFVLYGLAFVFHSLVTSPAAAHHGWIIRVYLVTGDPFADNRHLVAAGVALLGALEEMTWRGLVTPLLEERAGVLPGNVAATVLFAAAHIPTVFLLADPIAGLNPLLPLAAFGCGAAWAYLRWRMDRLVPSLLSHALFTWAVIEFPLIALGR